MRVDRLLMDLTRGQWAMSFEGVLAYAPLVHSIINGQSVPIAEKTHSILSVVDDNGKFLSEDKLGAIPKGSIAVIDMIGPVMKYGDMCTYGADEIAGALKFANESKNIKGIVLNIDGPGGSVSAIGPFMEFATLKKKPVVGLADQAASLHYWALCAVSDYKMASNNVSAGFGSVGVVSSFMDNTEMLKKLGYVFHEIYPDESAHKNLAYKLALEGKYDMIKEEHLSPIARKFQAAVTAACPNLKAKVEGVLTGKMFDADTAVQNGMIDGIGSMDQAINRAHIMSELNHYT